MICSKTKLSPELDKIKQLLIKNGYPADFLLSCISQKLANFAAEKPFGPEKCPVYLKLPWIGNVSSKFENQICKAITSCHYAVKSRVVYNIRVMLPSAKKDCVPATQTICCVYEFSCRCEAQYICKRNNSKINCELAIGQHLIANPECAKTYRRKFSDHWASKIVFSLKCLESVYIKTKNPVLCRQKEFVSALGLFKQTMLMGPNWSHLGPIRHILTH